MCFNQFYENLNIKSDVRIPFNILGCIKNTEKHRKGKCVPILDHKRNPKN